MDEDCLAEMASDLNPDEETGEDVAPNVAEIVGNRLRSRQSDEKLKILAKNTLGLIMLDYW